MKCVAYARGTAGVRGSAESLSFWRRVRLPLNQLRSQGVFSAFEVHDLGMEEELTEGMLIGPDVVVLHNFFPREGEIALLQEMHDRLRASGQVPMWVYDLECPSLLQEEEVLGILKLMRLVTVPNIYLQEEVDTLSLLTQQQVEMTPSTYELSTFAEIERQVRTKHANDDLFVLGCLGPHDWKPFLPTFFDSLYAHLPAASYSSLRVVTDSQEVATFCTEEWGVPTLGPIDDLFQPATYPRLLARCHVGLLPREGRNGEDSCLAWEYGAMHIPCIAASNSAYDIPGGGIQGEVLLPFWQVEEWAAFVRRWMTSKEGKGDYQRRVNQVFHAAMTHRVAMASTIYARVYRQMLPISPREK